MEKIGVVGLGLIGGSIFKRLKKKGFDVVGVSKSQTGDRIYQNYDVLKDCGIVFVCSAMNATMKILDELEGVLPSDTIVSDVCSLKSFVSKKFRPYVFIPSHPMAGTEKKGFENSFEEMFEGATWVLTPFNSTREEDLEKLVSVIKETGAKPLFTTAEEHDEAAAIISHMPLVVAQALYKCASGNELAMKMASSGFRGMTRLAMSNEEMANDMVQLNHKNIESAILRLYKSVGELLTGDYAQTAREIKSEREKL